MTTTSSKSLSSPGTASDERINQLMQKGYVVIPNALSKDEVEKYRLRLNKAREDGWQNGLNSVGNMWFDGLLSRDPQTFSPLVGHPSVSPLLHHLMGKQCQLRSLRAHINPGPYLQEWHLDYYGYWHERRHADEHPYAVVPMSINTTFYFQDNAPGIARLSFVARGHLKEPQHLEPLNHALFEKWCQSQEIEVIYPKAGDCVVFFSHIPHQGAKEDPTVERSNVVCHYQATPMHDKVWHVAAQEQYEGAFPFTRELAEIDRIYA